MFRKYAMLLLVLVLGTQLSACAVMVALPLQSAIDEAGATKLEPFVEIFEVKIDKAVATSTFRGVRVLPTVLKHDMETAKDAPIPRENEVNGIVTEEMLRLLAVSHANVSSPELRVGTLYMDEKSEGSIFWHYRSAGGGFAHWSVMSNPRIRIVQKLIDFRLTLRRGDAVLLEAHGLWGGNRKADEIAGARKLAQAIAQEVLKKLNVPASQRVPMAEAKKE